jgi:hypothetical protein
MNIYELSIYVNQEVDDTFNPREVTIWFNKAIANYNLIPPVTKYPFVWIDNPTTGTPNQPVDEFTANENDNDFLDEDGKLGYLINYPLSDTFMLGVILPYIVSSVKAQESSITEKQMALQEFMMNARTFKSSSNIKTGYLVDGEGNQELSQYKLGENVYLTDFNQAPFAGDWSKATAYKEYIIARKKDGTIVKYVDDSLVDEDIETMEQESEY